MSSLELEPPQAEPSAAAPTALAGLGELLLGAASLTIVVLAPVTAVLATLLLIRSWSRAAAMADSSQSALSVGLAGLLLLAAAVVMYGVIRRLQQRRELPRRLDWSLRLSPLVALIVGLAAITGWAEAAVSAMLWAAAVAAVAGVFWRERAAAQNTDLAQDNAGQAAEASPADEAESPTVDDHSLEQTLEGQAGELASAAPPTPGALQARIERRSLDDGRPAVSIWQRLTAPPWQQRVTLHFPFWPPFSSTPEVGGEVLAEAGASLQLPQVERHGCRVLVELDEADERSQVVELELYAVEPEAHD